MPFDYLLHESAADTRAYAQSAASDGVITYSTSSNHNEIQKNWVRRVYEYLGSILNVGFQEVAAGGEFRIDVQNESDFYSAGSGNGIHNSVGTSGDLFWRSWHDKKQYGGVESQRQVVKMIGRSLGLSYPDGQVWNNAYTTNNSIVSENGSGPNGNMGHTNFFTDDDQQSLRSLYGAKDVVTGIANHVRQRAEEDLLIGFNGQTDYFYLVSKGINYLNQSSRFVEPSGRAWHNDYIIPSLVNFNPEEGDRILIQRRLFVPFSPVYPGTPSSSIPKKFDYSGKKIIAKSYLKKLRIRFQDDQPLQTLPSDQQGAVMTSSVNLNINGAGKLMINANGTNPNMGPYPDDLSVNAQLLAFLDVYGPYGPAIKGEWFGLF